MPDLIGKTLGPYRIIEQIGLGGMATVYKAYQPAMDRYVALKVLSTHLTQDPTFLKRFQQEARVIAKLEHLHILPVYDHGEEEGYLYLVMRFIQAGTLKDRLEKGPLPLEEARRVVMQVGSALEYAHQLGVVHRDIKPSNVLIDPQGDCYLTDFGIAKMVEGTLGLTGSGVIGTPHYMSPEQGQSIKVDHRADIYAMGVVIYEMVTGRLPYDAETPFAVVMKHITEPLPLPRSLRPDLPEEIERVILKALAKAPADRYQSMRDLVTAFDQAVRAAPTEARMATAPPRVAPLLTVVEEAEPEPTAVVPPPTMVPAWRQWVTAQSLWLLAAAGLGLLVLVLAGVILSRVPARVEISGGQVQVVLPTATVEVTSPVTPGTTVAGTATPVPVSTLAPAQTLRPTPTPQPAPTLTPAPVTAKQCRIVYEHDRDIYVSDCDGSGERRLTDHPAADMFPAWSPDGQRIVFNSERDRQPLPDGSVHDSLNIMSASGSGLTRLTSGDYNDLYPAWAPDGSRIAFHRNCSLMTIAPDGSDLALILPGSDEVCADSPAWSPDGQRLAFVSWERPEPRYFTVYVISTAGTNLRRLARVAAKFAVPVWSPDGQQIGVRIGEGAGATQYYLLNADGSGEPVEVHSIPDSWFSWYWPQWGIQKAQVSATPTSAAACRIAFLNGDGNVYVRNCDGSGEMKITNLKSIIPPGVANNMLSWSPDGKYIMFQSIHEREPGNVDPLLYKVNADGSGLTRLTSGNRHDRFPVWSPDGKLIAFHSNCTLKTIAPDGSSEKTIVAAGPAEGTGICPNTVAWSPDSKQLAFVSWYDPFPENEKYILYVVNSDGTNLRKLRKFEGGAIPTWSPDGKQIGVEDMGNAYLLNADGSGEPVKVSSIPDSWHAWHWPQWGGEAQTPTPLATPSPSAQAAQASAFAEPILAAIKDRPPDYQDDFSNPGSGWGRGLIVDQSGWEEGERGYMNGEYYVSAPPAKLRPQKPDQPITCAGGHLISQRSFSDMVLEVEGRFVEVRDGNWHVIFHQSYDPATNASGEYKVMFEPNGHVSIGKSHSIEGDRNLAEMRGVPVQTGLEPNRLQILAVGPQIAIYMNGEPALFAADPDFDDRYKSGLFDLVVCNLGDTPLEARWDNLKIWDISKLTLP